MSLVKFSNGKNRNSLVPGIDDIFESFFNDSFFSDRMISRVPAVNICETENEYHIELAVPGMQKEDFKVELDRNMLTISAERKAENTENNKKYNKREFNYTSFVRSFALPDSADDAQIEAGYHNGLLDIRVAKKEEAKTVTRQIDIK